MTLETTIKAVVNDQFQLKMTVNRMKREVDLLKKEMTRGDNLTKYQFRNLLTQTQKLIFDNFELLKNDLGLTVVQVAQLRTWTKDFEMASSVDLNDPSLSVGLNMVLTWNLQYNGEVVFTQADVDRILAGELPE